MTEQMRPGPSWGDGDDRFLPWRVAQLEQWRRDVEEKANPMVMVQEVRAMRDEFRSVKRLLWGLLASSVGAGLTVILTVLTHTH